jgi:hypothetical protein
MKIKGSEAMWREDFLSMMKAAQQTPTAKPCMMGETPSLTRRATLTVIVTGGPGQMNRKKKSVVKQKKVYRY